MNYWLWCATVQSRPLQHHEPYGSNVCGPTLLSQCSSACKCQDVVVEEFVFSLYGCMCLAQVWCDGESVGFSVCDREVTDDGVFILWV